MAVILGKGPLGPVHLDVEALIETRLLIQSNSGGGKSWALRRILEKTAGKVQQLVIDPEGEFATLREKYDMVICAPHGADAVARPQTAALLARRLLETGVSAVLDIYDLKAHERQDFVRRFLDAIVNAPRKLWRPVMVVLDEAHIFAPEKGKAESTAAVIDIATRGRKRGQCLVAATQRLSKLHKDVAAELLNKMIGRTSLDIDVRRAADELGLTNKTATENLRLLHPGQFYVYGPAFDNGTGGVTQMTVGSVRTTHPQRGNRMMTAPPAPSPKIRKVLSDLGDLQKEAEQEARSMAELKTQVRALKTDLTILKKTGVPEAEVRSRERAAADAALEKAQKMFPNESDIQARIDTAYQDGANSIDPVDPSHVEALQTIQETARTVLAKYDPLGKPVARGPSPKPIPRAPAVPRPSRETQSAQEDSRLRAGAVRILKELSVRYPASYSRSQVALLTRFSPKGGTFNTYLGDLRRQGFIKEEGVGKSALVFATDEGLRYLGGDIPAAPTTHVEVMSMWQRALRAGCYKMLEAIVEAGAQGIHRENLAISVEMEISGGTFNTYLGDLRRNGLITESNKVSTANNILYPGET